MRRVICGILCVLMVLGFATTAFAGINGEVKTYGTPFLITNAGQGPGGKMARLLVSQAGTVVLDTDGRQQVIYKHAISTVVPLRPVALRESEEEAAL